MWQGKQLCDCLLAQISDIIYSLSATQALWLVTVGSILASALTSAHTPTAKRHSRAAPRSPGIKIITLVLSKNQRQPLLQHLRRGCPWAPEGQEAPMMRTTTQPMESLLCRSILIGPHPFPLRSVWLACPNFKGKARTIILLPCSKAPWPLLYQVTCNARWDTHDRTRPSMRWLPQLRRRKGPRLPPTLLLDTTHLRSWSLPQPMASSNRAVGTTALT